MLFRQLFDAESSTYTYLIADPDAGEAMLIDPVLEQVERDFKLLNELGLTLRYCLETHIHADHVTGTGKLRQLTGCLSIVPEHAEAGCADHHIRDGETVQLKSIIISALATPGHTDSHMAYLVSSKASQEMHSTRVLTGDALFIVPAR